MKIRILALISVIGGVDLLFFLATNDTFIYNANRMGEGDFPIVSGGVGAYIVAFISVVIIAIFTCALSAAFYFFIKWLTEPFKGEKRL